MAVRPLPGEVLAAAARVRASAVASADWETLAGRACGCTACPELVATRTQVVVGEAPPGARVLLLGEAPGAHEDETGRVFVGRAGQLLDTLLAEAGLPRGEVAVVNVLRCRPPGNRPPSRAEAARCRGWLDRQLQLAAPRVVVAMGTTAAAALLGRLDSLAAARAASPHPGTGVLVGGQVLATYHPSAAIRFGPRGLPREALAEDLARARTLSEAAGQQQQSAQHEQ